MWNLLCLRPHSYRWLVSCGLRAEDVGWGPVHSMVVANARWQSVCALVIFPHALSF